MDINKNLELLNTFIIKKGYSFSDKLYIINLAKISRNIDELKDNINWEKTGKIWNKDKDMPFWKYIYLLFYKNNNYGQI